MSAPPKIRAKRGESGAEPETNNSKLPPKASCHLEKISLRAIFNLKS